MISEYHYNILGSESFVAPAIVNARGPAAYLALENIHNNIRVNCRAQQ